MDHVVGHNKGGKNRKLEKRNETARKVAWGEHRG